MSKVTIEDVAKAAGVSRALVSIAYRGASGVSKTTAAQIFEAGERLGYVPNVNAARLASKKLKTVGVFLQDLHNEVFADVYDGIRSVLGDKMPVVLATGSPDLASDARAVENLIAARVDVIIAVGLTITDSELDALAKRASIISVTRQSPFVHSVSADDYAGAAMATQHLIAQGHRAIGFLANPQTDGYRERMSGYIDAMAEAKLSPLVRTTSYSRADAELDADALIEAGATAIFSHNDSTGLGVLDALVSKNLRPGVDVAVVGFDNTSLSQAPILALSSVNPHSQRLGEEAATVALEELTGVKQQRVSIKIEPELIIRASSAAPFSS